MRRAQRNEREKERSESTLRTGRPRRKSWDERVEPDKREQREQREMQKCAVRRIVLPPEKHDFVVGGHREDVPDAVARVLVIKDLYSQLAPWWVERSGFDFFCYYVLVEKC